MTVLSPKLTFLFISEYIWKSHQRNLCLVPFSLSVNVFQTINVCNRKMLVNSKTSFVKLVIQSIKRHSIGIQWELQFRENLLYGLKIKREIATDSLYVLSMMSIEMSRCLPFTKNSRVPHVIYVIILWNASSVVSLRITSHRHLMVYEM